MVSNTYDELVREENRHKEKVYGSFAKMRSVADAEADAKKKYVNSGAYEEHSAFIAHGELALAEKQRRNADAIIQSLYRCPYFAHIDLQDLDGDSLHFYLSDCETLDESVAVDERSFLVPFIQDSKRPISEALHKCYHRKDGNEVTCDSPQGEQLSYRPQLICDDKIDNRVLLSVTPHYPKQDSFHIDADELLDEKLRENRNDPTLQNIISTLQQEQFQIISTDTSVSFVVQGCAGSGKSQCLLHRLFYLREGLSQKGWEHVLLLTPTKLFRHYSANLIRRYRLSQINDCSIAELYRAILNTYDPRFRNRQYRFELSEEYLPDEYLREIYEPEIIVRIDTEINRAIRKYVQAGCDALGINMPHNPDAEFIASLLKRLDDERSKYDAREAILKQSPEYQEKRVQHQQLQKLLETAQKNLAKANIEAEEIQEAQLNFNEALRNLKEAEEERTSWVQQRQERISAAQKELAYIANEMGKLSTVLAPAQYARRLYILQSMTSGDMFVADEGYLKFLNEYCDEAKSVLQAVINKQSKDAYAKKLNIRTQENRKKCNTLAAEVSDLNSKVDNLVEWLRMKAAEIEGVQSQITIHRSELEKSKYFLSRIESTVFESEVWNVLLPIKEKYGIKTVQVDVQEDGRQRETRILYKSDLLYYVKIYAQIHSNSNLPDYRMICIDEGQDLHKADYDILRTLFPEAVFNVFGDLAQTLHASCGVDDWQKATGIRQIYKLERNYRNMAAIVNYCNVALGSNMQYIGKVHDEQKPQIISDDSTLKRVASITGIVTIVKDNQSFQDFCTASGKNCDEFEYLDTKAEQPTGTQPACYSIFAAKGLEFSKVLVYSRAMSQNQKNVACTRAMERLYYYE